MSYILDALKKLEQEKSRKSRAVGKINITGELFGSERVRPAEGRRMWTVLIVVCAVLVTFGTTLFFLKGKGGGRSSVSSRPNATQPGPTVNVPTPVPVPIAPAPPVQTPPVQQIPAAPSQAVMPTSATPATVATQPAAAEDDMSDDDGRERRRRRHKIPIKAAVPQAQETVGVKSGQSPVGVKTGQAPADIKVSGIAWQDDRRARRAVVNGFLLREGAIVSGAKITEILQDRVRFSLSGTTFEVTFISAGTPGSGK